MIVKDISGEIICEHKEECKSYHRLNNKSKCPTCKNNKHKNPRELKEDYYESKSDALTTLIYSVLLLLILILIL